MIRYMDGNKMFKMIHELKSNKALNFEIFVVVGLPMLRFMIAGLCLF